VQQSVLVVVPHQQIELRILFRLPFYLLQDLGGRDQVFVLQTEEQRVLERILVRTEVVELDVFYHVVGQHVLVFRQETQLEGRVIVLSRALGSK